MVYKRHFIREVLGKSKNRLLRLLNSKAPRRAIKTLLGALLSVRTMSPQRISWCSDNTLMVEARRVELLSENHLPQLSPSAVYLLHFLPRNADKQALRFRIPFFMTESGHPPCTFTANRRPYPSRGALGKNGSLNQAAAKTVLFSFNFKVAAD